MSLLNRFGEGKENDDTEIKPRNQILQTSLKPEAEQKEKLESNERKKHNEFTERYKAPESNDKEKLNVNKKSEGNASGANNESDPDKGQRIREYKGEER